MTLMVEPPALPAARYHINKQAERRSTRPGRRYLAQHLGDLRSRGRGWLAGEEGIDVDTNPAVTEDTLKSLVQAFNRHDLDDVMTFFGDHPILENGRLSPRRAQPPCCGEV
jgi:predicted metal-dependent phosphoesterase TrpH